jgi:hypothetical protein
MQRLSQENLHRFSLIPFEEVERHPRKVSADTLVSYGANRYSVPWRYVGQTVHVQDEQNGRLRIYSGSTCIAEHEKAAGRHRVVVKRQHLEGIRSAGGKPISTPSPRLVPQEIPKVTHRELSVYEQLLEEEVPSWS